MSREPTPDELLQKHFGFVTSWHLAAPFENTKGVGYAKVYALVPR